MKTHKLMIDGEERDVIEVGYAWAYSLRKELEAMIDKPVNEDKFFTFLDQEFHQISEALEEAWNNWEDEQ